MTSQRVVIDPITRIEGHLRIELETSDGKITNAWACATQFRGIEKILQGRDPRDAWALAQRICGVCTGVHAIASSLAAAAGAAKALNSKTARVLHGNGRMRRNRESFIGDNDRILTVACQLSRNKSRKAPGFSS
jgi:hypothetical protein